jgi:hypothetical protein
VAPLGVLAPLVAELLERHAQRPAERPLHAERRHEVHHVGDRLVAPAAPHVLPEREAVAVREVPVGALRHLLHARQPAVDRGVAHPRVGLRVFVAERQELGHPLHEPERRAHPRQPLEVRPGLAAREDVELELVHHLVHEHVLERAVVARERLGHALPQRVGDAAGALAEVAEHVALREVAAAGEQEERLLLAELVPEQPRQARVRPLGHARGVDRGLALGRVVVHEEVLGLEHPPVEAVVLHQVLPEIQLRPGRRGGAGAGQGEEQNGEECAGEPRGGGTAPGHGGTPQPAAAGCSTGTVLASPHRRSSW